MVKEVADQHHGRVTLESEPGVGSTFTIRVPLASDDPVVLASMDKNDLRRLERDEGIPTPRMSERQRKEAERQRRAASKGAGKSATGQLKLQWPLIQTSKKKSQEGGEPK